MATFFNGPASRPPGALPRLRWPLTDEQRLVDTGLRTELLHTTDVQVGDVQVPPGRSLWSLPGTVVKSQR